MHRQLSATAPSSCQLKRREALVAPTEISVSIGCCEEHASAAKQTDLARVFSHNGKADALDVLVQMRLDCCPKGRKVHFPSTVVQDLQV